VKNLLLGSDFIKTEIQAHCTQLLLYKKEVRQTRFSTNLNDKMKNFPLVDKEKSRVALGTRVSPTVREYTILKDET
jgi:hypothetical protein